MNELEKFEKLQEQINFLSQEKIRFEERFKAEKEKLEALLKEVESKGYDPKNLGEIKIKLEQSLKDDIAALEKLVAEVSEKMKSMEEAAS